MANKGTGFQNIRKSPAVKLWRYFTDPDVHSWADTELQTPAVNIPPVTSSYLDPREYSAAQMLSTRPSAPASASAVAPATGSPSRGFWSPKLDMGQPTTFAGSLLTGAVNPGLTTVAAGAPPSTPAAPVSPAADAAARPYAYHQPAVRNAFTLGAPADDERARLKVAEAAARFNDAEKSYNSLKTPEAKAALEEAQREHGQWNKWAAMSPESRKQVLMAGERASLAAQGRDNFATLRNEMDSPGAAELLAYAAAVNSGGPAVTRQPDGSATVSGRYGSGFTTGATVKPGTRTAQSIINDNLLLDQAAQAGIAPERAADILRTRRI